GAAERAVELREEGGPVDREQQAGLAFARRQQAVRGQRADSVRQLGRGHPLRPGDMGFGRLAAAESRQRRAELARQPLAEAGEVGQRVDRLAALPEQRVAMVRGQARGPRWTFGFHWTMKERKWTLSTPPKPSVASSTALIAAVRRFCSLALPSGEETSSSAVSASPTSSRERIASSCSSSHINTRPS